MTQKWNLQDIRPTEPRRPQGEGRPISTSNQAPRPTLDPRATASPRPLSERPRAQSSGIDMRVPVRHTETTEPEEEIADHFAQSDDEERIPIINGRSQTKKHVIIATVIFLAITGAGLFVSHLMGGATVTVHPKVRELNVNAEFTAYKEQRPEELTYEILTLEATSERQVEASGQEEVKVQATGEIEIQKTTAGAERLIKNTRFESPDGLIFRIEESVVVPGAVTVDGKSVPGTIRAKVFADEAGDKYNLKAGTTLKVPGFKEGDYMDLYNAISATNPVAFTNGFAGPKFIINDAALSTARQSLQAELRDTLLARVATEKPAGQTSFTGSVAITYNELPAVQYGDKLVTIKEQAILQMPLFNAESFASFIAKETIVGYDGAPVRIDNLQNLNFAYTSATTSQTTLANLDSLNFKIVGVPTIVWTFDEGKLKLDLAGKQKTAITQIMASYKGIERSEVKIRPVWKRTMPDDHTEIEVVEVVSDEKSE